MNPGGYMQFRDLVAGFLMVVCVPGLARAQGGASSASVAGRVADGQGLALPGVTVTVTNESTKQARTVVTEGEGVCRVYALTPSSYSLGADLPGFATLKLTGLVLNVGAVVERDLTLQVAAVSETVTVRGESPLVEGSRTDLSTVVTREEIESLPTNSRNYLDFTLLTPMSV